MLTEPQFANRLRDLYSYGKEKADPMDIKLLRIGRHMRIPSAARIVCTRNETEYEPLMELVKDEYLIFDTADCAGSTVVLIPSEAGVLSEADISFQCFLCCRKQKYETLKSKVCCRCSWELKSHQIIAGQQCRCSTGR